MENYIDRSICSKQITGGNISPSFAHWTPGRRW